MNLMHYKGYRAKPEYSPDDKIFYGRVMGIRDMIHFQSDTAEDLEKEFRESVDDYLEFCKEIGKEPEREFDGHIQLHISPELHMKLAVYAEEKGIIIDKAIKQAIHAFIQQHQPPEDILTGENDLKLSDMALNAARLMDMLPEEEQNFAYEFLKRMVRAWDPDYTRLTPEEARRLEAAEKSGFVDEDVTYTLEECEREWGLA